MADKIPFKTLDEIVDIYMIQAFIDNRRFYPNYLNLAATVWEDLFKDTLISNVKKYVPVKHDGNFLYIEIPGDCLRVWNVGVADECGNMQPFFNNENKVIIHPPLPLKCGCVDKSCTCNNAMCVSVDELTVTTKEIIIDNGTYTQKIWKKKCKNGSVIEFTETPTKNFDNPESPTIENITTERLICTLDVEPCGCVKETIENRKKVVDLCGCDIPCLSRCPSTSIPIIHNAYGQMKIDDDRRRIYLFPRNECNQVILSYQTDGKCGKEQLTIPEYAVDAVLFGIKFRSVAIRSRSDSEIRSAEGLYRREVTKLQMFLNPIRLDEFARLDSLRYAWE